MDIRNGAIIAQFVCNARRIEETGFKRLSASYPVDYNDIYVIYRKDITAASAQNICVAGNIHRDIDALRGHAHNRR
jgi:hypothetical protein